MTGELLAELIRAIWWLAFYLSLCIAAGIFASQRGRSPFGWFLVSFLLTPLVGFVYLLVLPRGGTALSDWEEHQRRKRQRDTEPKP